MQLYRPASAYRVLVMALALGLGSSVGCRSTFARPVSWLGGWSLMTDARPELSEWMITRTALPDFSMGAHFSRVRGSDRNSTVWLAQANGLAYRWLENDVQANLYGSLGGGARITPTKSTTAVLAAVEADWETRRSYANTRIETLASPRLVPIQRLLARAGFAPYLAPFEGLHTWLVLEGDLRDHHSGVRLTPILRVFYQNVLWEIGTSLEEGDTHLAIAIEL